MPDLALFLQFGHRGPSLLDVLVRVGPVDLIEVDRVHSEPSQTGLTLAPDRRALEAVTDLSLLIPSHAALGEDVRAFAHPCEGAGNHFLGVAQAIDRGGVDPVDAGIECFVDGGDGVAVVLTAPRELPTRAAGGPGPEADRGDEQVRISERFRSH